MFAMIRTFAFTAVSLLLLSGCGKIDTSTTQDNNTIEEPTTPAYNCKNTTPTNSYGCYDSTVLFHGETVTDGIWSIYTQSNTNRTDGVTFYDRYQYGFDFSGDGSASKQQKTDGYVYYREWGINDGGTALTLSEDGTYTYVAVFSGQNCFQVTNGGSTLKMCHESFVDQSQSNAAGYYGTGVAFGNRADYDFTAVGSWSIAGYGDNTVPAATVVLDANGTTSNAQEWGVSADGKVMEIDGVRYLVYQYLDTPDNNCIATFELAGGVITPTTWKLCKLP